MNVGKAMALLGLTALPRRTEDLESAYRVAIRAVHPDRGGDVRDAQRVNEAREILRPHVGGSPERITSWPGLDAIFTPSDPVVDPVDPIGSEDLDEVLSDLFDYDFTYDPLNLV